MGPRHCNKGLQALLLDSDSAVRSERGVMLRTRSVRLVSLVTISLFGGWLSARYPLLKKKISLSSSSSVLDTAKLEAGLAASSMLNTIAMIMSIDEGKGSSRKLECFGRAK